MNEINPKLLPWSVIVDVLQNPLDYQYRFWGTQRVKLIGVEMTGLKSSDIPDQYMREGNIKEYLEVVEKRSPLLCATPISKPDGRHVHFQSIRLPFKVKDGGVSHIFSAINYEELTQDHYAYYGTRKLGT